MALLFFDKKIIKQNKEICKELFTSLDIKDVRQLDLGVIVIKFNDSRYGDLDPVMARLTKKGELYITDNTTIYDA